MAIDEWTATSGNWITGTDWNGGEPTPSSDVLIASTNGVTVTSSAAETVNTIAINDTDVLDIDSGDSNPFTASTGAPDGIFGVVEVEDGLLTVGNGGSAFYNNSGTLLLSSPVLSLSSSSVLQIDGTVTFNGGGAILLGPNGNNRIFGTGNSTLIDVDNVVSGSGAIGRVNFINETTVETGFLDEGIDIYGTAEGGEFDNENLLLANDGGPLLLGDGASSAIIGNTGTIEIQNDDPDEMTEIGIRDNVTIDCSGGGQILLAGANSDGDSIVSFGGPASLTLEDGTLSASGGSIGDPNLTLNLVDFDIDIKGPGDSQLGGVAGVVGIRLA